MTIKHIQQVTADYFCMYSLYIQYVVKLVIHSLICDMHPALDKKTFPEIFLLRKRL